MHIQTHYFQLIHVNKMQVTLLLVFFVVK
jgi:hypothetical protein